MHHGWQRLIAEPGVFRGEGRFPIAAYSEFMPPPRIAIKPSGAFEYDSPFNDDDPFGWRITAREQEHQIASGLPIIARQFIEMMVSLATGHGAHRIGQYHLKDNLYWPDMLHGQALAHEHYAFLSPLALSKTQDDKGRVRWSLFGASTDGPARGFWRSFFSAPEAEIPEIEALNRIRTIIAAVYGFSPDALCDLRAAGFRIRPTGQVPDRPEWSEGPLPKWTKEYLLDGSDPGACRYLLTFTPFALLPGAIQRAYLSGTLNLLPSPASMVFWGSPLIRRLSGTLPFADQVLLLNAIARHEGRGIRVPQSGWLHHSTNRHAGHDPGLGAIRATMRRTHRWQRVLRDDDDLEFAREDRVHVALFSTHPDDVRLYGKPMARNAQIWSSEFEAVLHGPAAGRAEIGNAIKQMEEGGSFGYRFFYPPMQAGQRSMFWHRPLVAYWNAQVQAAQVVDCGVEGYLATVGVKGELEERVELWPRVGNPLGIALPPPSVSPHSRLDTSSVNGGGKLRREQKGGGVPGADQALTFGWTATRAFEVRYWKTIADLAEGRYLNKNSGDCVRDAVTQARLPHLHADLDPLADHLLNYYGRLATRVKTAERVLTGDLPFRWQTDFEFPWMGGWLENQEGRRAERDIITVIPGKNRSEAVIMADHYDTAYMEDIYGDRPGIRGDGARLAAAGADDNHSATAALMLGARVFLDLSRRGLLDCDIWLVHLTGEEFPADCLGARALTERLIEGTLRMRLAGGGERDLSRTTVRGVYVLDMIAHNNDRARDIFQIAPGTSRAIAVACGTGERRGTGMGVWNGGLEPQSRRGKGLGRGPALSR